MKIQFSSMLKRYELPTGTKSVTFLLLGLLPIITFPYFTDTINLPKLILLDMLGVVLGLSWVVATIKSKQLGFTNSSLNKYVNLVLLTLVFSGGFAVNKTASFFGPQDKWFPGVLAWLAVFVVYYGISNLNLKPTEKLWLVRIVMLSLGLAALNIITRYYITTFNPPWELYLPGNQISSSVFFATVAGAWLYFYLETKYFAAKIGYAAGVLINFISLTILTHISSLILGLVSCSLALAISTQPKKFHKALILLIPSLAFYLLFNFGQLPSLKTTNITIDKPLPLTTSWKIAASAVRDFPLFGTGIGTFKLSYAKYKPVEVNTTPYWAIRFDYPFSEVLNYLATGGLLVTGAMLVFYVKLFKATLETKNLYLVLASCLALAAWFSNLTLLNTVFMFIFAALGSTDPQDRTELRMARNTNSERSLLYDFKTTAGSYFILVLPLGLLLVLVNFYVYNLTKSELYAYKALQALARNDIPASISNQSQAIAQLQSRTEYRRTYSALTFNVANELLAKKSLTADQKATALTILAKAVNNLADLTTTTFPQEVENWELRGDISRALISSGIAKNAHEDAITAYKVASTLDPTNPMLKYALATVYESTKQYPEALALYVQALTLKPDLHVVRLKYARLLVNQKDYVQARVQFQLLTKLVKDKRLLDLISEDVKNLATLEQSTTPQKEAVPLPAKPVDTQPK